MARTAQGATVAAGEGLVGEGFGATGGVTGRGDGEGRGIGELRGVGFGIGVGDGFGTTGFGENENIH